MSLRRTLLSIAFIASLAPSLPGQEPEPPTVPAPGVQERAESLWERARLLSDIHAKNAPAFPLNATFTFVEKDLEYTQGTYTEVWVSDSQWRRETLVNDLRRIEVGTANRIWTLDNSKDFPETATRLPALVNIFPPASSTFEFDSIADNTDQKPPERCATTKVCNRSNTDSASTRKAARCSPSSRPRSVQRT